MKISVQVWHTKYSDLYVYSIYTIFPSDEGIYAFNDYQLLSNNNVLCYISNAPQVLKINLSILLLIKSFLLNTAEHHEIKSYY